MAWKYRISAVNGGFRRERWFHRRFFLLQVVIFKIAPDMALIIVLHRKRHIPLPPLHLHINMCTSRYLKWYLTKFYPLILPSLNKYLPLWLLWVDAVACSCSCLVRLSSALSSTFPQHDTPQPPLTNIRL